MEEKEPDKPVENPEKEVCHRCATQGVFNNAIRTAKHEVKHRKQTIKTKERFV